MLGTQLLHYQIESHLGAGGMGEVYRARDTRLGRSVAIKVLPVMFAQDPERGARFEREARLLASLNHPNIAALHGLEAVDGRHFIVMELVEGDTLAGRIARGPIPVEEALAIGRQICEALEAAHEKGVIHRDLKPANVKITPDGKVKVLDFGLAKAVEGAPASPSVLNSPTISIAATHAGVILGTAAYMSPEQAKGYAADHRSDVFSFGCVLYEMLTGRQSFQGDTMTEVIASVLKTDPDVTLLPPNLHPRIGEVLRRCLAKDPKNRWHAVADVRVELESILADPRGTAVRVESAAVAQPMWRRAIPLVVTAVLAATLTGTAMWLLRPSAAASVTRFSILLPDDHQLTRIGRHNVALSPDGRHLVYVANNQLYLRSMDELDVRPVAGTNQDITTPFFSPDGQWVAFYSASDSKLKRVAITGGASVTIADSPNPFGASWAPGDQVYVGLGSDGIGRVPSNGGTLEPVITPGENEVMHGPQLLPDGEHLLFTVTRSAGASRWDEAQIVVQSLSTAERTVLVHGGSDARYVPTGHIVYALSSNLLAVPFDLDKLQLLGGPVPVLERVLRSAPANTAAAFFTLSETGSLAYFVGDQLTAQNRTLATVDRSGKAVPLPIPTATYSDPRLSPDGRQMVVSLETDSTSNLWVYDLSGAVAPRRLTFEGTNGVPFWASDGKHLIFISNREDNRFAIYRQPADGTGVPERLTPHETTQPSNDLFLSRDGTILLYRDERQEGDVWMVPLTGDRKPQVVIGGPTAHFLPALSPDGRWIAYTSTEGGSPQVYVQPFPPTGAKYLVSNAASRAPLWSPDGKQLYFLEELPSNLGRIVAVDVQTQTGFTFGNATRLFEPVDRNGGRWPYTISPDGQRLVVVLRGTDAGTGTRLGSELRVTLNWFDELKQRAPLNSSR